MPFCSPAEQNLVERSYVLHKFLWIISCGGVFYAESCIFFWELPPEKKCKKSLETRDFAFGCRNEKGGDSASPPKEDRLWRLQFRLTGCSRCWRYESGQRWRIPGRNTRGRTAAALPRGRRPFRLVRSASRWLVPRFIRHSGPADARFHAGRTNPPFPHGGVSPAGG